MKTAIRYIFDNKKHRVVFYICISALVALICTVLSYPGIMYSDSFSRWFMANNFANGEFCANSNWLSVFPQFIMAFCFKLSGEYGLYTFLMAFLFYASTLLLADAYLSRFKTATILILIFCPVFYGMSVFVEMGLGVIVGINTFLLIFEYFPISSYAKFSPLKKVLFYSICAFSYLMVFGYRQNAITVLPVFLFVIFIAFRTSKMSFKKMLLKQLAVIVTVLVAIALIPKVLMFQDQYNVTSVGFLWDTIKMLEKLEDKPEYNNYLDFMGENATALALESNNHQSVNGFAERIPFGLIGNPEMADAINRRFVKLALSEPLTFLQTKTASIVKIMGLYGPLYDGEYQYNAYKKMPEYNYSDTFYRKAFFNSYVNFQQKIPIFRIPIIWFTLAFLLWLAAFKKKERYFESKGSILLLMACFYYGAFFINAQSAEFRYFFPSFYLLLLSAQISLCKISADKKMRLKKGYSDEQVDKKSYTHI